MSNMLTTDPLMQCLVILTKLNHKPTSAEVLASGLPFEPGSDKQRLFSIDNAKANFSRAAEKVGFISQLKRRKLKDIPSLVLPVILTLKGDNACVLLEINRKDKTAQVIIPSLDEAPVQVNLEKLEQGYLGYAFFLKRKYEGFGQEQLTGEFIKRKNWFFGTLMKFKGIYGRVLLATFLVNLFVIAGPIFTLNVYDRIIPHNAIDTLWVLAAGVALIYIFDLVLKHIRTYFLENAARRSDVILSSMLFEQAMSIKLENKPRSVGAFSSIIKDFDGIRSFFASGAITAFIDLPFAAVFLLVIYSINNIIVLIPLATILLILLLSIPMRHSIQKVIDSTHEATHQRNSILVESLANLETIKAFNADSSMQWHWEESTGFIAGKTQRSRVRSGSLATLTGFLSQCCSVAIIIAGVYLIKERELTMGGLIAINILSSRSIAPFSQAISLMLNFGQMKVGLKSLNEFMEKEIERPEKKKFIHRPTLQGEIEFKDVGFSYPEEQTKAISNISFHITPGERVGIIGAVGSGKSTIGKLLLGLFDPGEGAVFIDGLDIKQIDPVDLRHNFSYVPQDVVLFSGTVRDNITLKSPHAGDSEILTAAKIGKVDAFTDRHPMGMDLQVGERGFALSGGQRQSVAVAMAFIDESPVVLLDEPTNAMDFNTETQVISNLSRVTKGKTTLIITHKPSILNIVDRILVMDKGRLVMDGPKKEIFAKLGGKVK
ncbi:type I secretion system permease/ATPase [Desulfobacula sp.]|uniref:type I secretion system permease/ATPase n=1 Tax=Desulfobacula sp. TaxID=2593537 RepID=UPI0025C17BD1|nr:type I secretion system permease/ATPase [Desulfobacula sp.]MBC2703937.1 type I secretion system permease/ATPase [Desulfobacula sp.]